MQKSVISHHLLLSLFFTIVRTRIGKQIIYDKRVYRVNKYTRTLDGFFDSFFFIRLKYKNVVQRTRVSRNDEKR